MNRIYLCFLFLLSTFTALAQDFPEPEFIGEAVICDLKTGQFRKLPKERAIKRNANMMGYATTKLVMNTNISPLEISDQTDCAIIIKAENNRYDPMALFQVFRFEKNIEGARVCELASASIGRYYSEADANNKKYVEFSAKKYGESSYILTFPIYAGQYGILTGAMNDDALIISTFGVFDYEARRLAALEEAKRQQAEMERQRKKQQKKANRK